MKLLAVFLIGLIVLSGCSVSMNAVSRGMEDLGRDFCQGKNMQYLETRLDQFCVNYQGKLLEIKCSNLNEYSACFFVELQEIEN